VWITAFVVTSAQLAAALRVEVSGIPIDLRLVSCPDVFGAEVLLTSPACSVGAAATAKIRIKVGFRDMKISGF
jgi:hypothetical protein